MPKLDWSILEKKKSELDWSILEAKEETKPKPDWSKLEKKESISPDWGLVDKKSPSLNWASLEKDIQPKETGDIAKITKLPDTTEKVEEPSTVEKWGYSVTRSLSAIIEKPAWALTEGVFRGIRGISRFADKIRPNFEIEKGLKEKIYGFLDNAIEYYSHPEKYGIVTPSATKTQEWARQKSYQKNFLMGISGDVAEATTDLVSLFIQMAVIKKASPSTALGVTRPLTEIAKHTTRMGVHGFLTTSGDLGERTQSALYRIGYNLTPYIANATGATGLTAVMTDTLLNTFLTSPTYIKAYQEAGGVNKEFLSMAIPQFVMDVGMAWNTRGLPENIRKQKINSYLEGRAKEMGLPKEEAKNLFDKFHDVFAGEEARERLYQQYVNRFQSLENITDKAKFLGADIKTGEDPRLVARSYLGMGQKAQSVLENKTYRITPEGKIEITGEGLKPILDIYDKVSPEKKGAAKREDLVDYLISQRTLKDLQREIKVGGETRTIATEKQTKEAQQTMERLNKKYKGNIEHLENTAQELYGYQKRILHLLVDSGVMSEDTYNMILSQNPHYVPFDRVIGEDEITAGTPVSKKRFTGARSPVKKIKGSEKEIHNPIESIIKNTYRIMDIAGRNNVALSVSKLKDILPEYISPIRIQMQPIKLTEKEAGEEKTIFRPSQFKPKGNVIEYFENGKRKYMEVTPNLYQAMTGLDEAGMGLMVKIFSKPASWLRTGATITPEFILRNPIRDQLTALLQTKVGFIPFIDTIRALSDVWGKTNTYYDWLRSGGAYSGFVELTRDNLKRAYKELQQPFGKKLLSKLNIINTAQDLSVLFEQATRVGVYKRAIKKMTPIEAGFQSREATVDFARRGSKTKDINAIIAFFNAGIQGIDKSIRTAKDDPVGISMKAIATITLPSLLLYLKNRKDPDFKEIPQWERDLFWITKFGETYVRIPKPFLYGQVFGSLPERFFEYLDTREPDAFKGIESSLYEAMLPFGGDPASGLLPTGIKPLIENEANWSFFRESRLVPVGKERLLPEEQSGKYTTETAKGISKLIGKLPDIPIIKNLESPAKLENLIRGWFGGSGKYALQGGDLLIKGIKKTIGQEIKPKRPKEWADIPLIKGFVTRPPYSGSAESLQKFYETKEEINKAYNTYRRLRSEGRMDAAKKVKEKYPEWAYSKILNKYSEMISTYGKLIDRIIESDKYTEKEKRERINELEKKRVNAAKRANALIKRKRERSKK